jgi:hypothetical protein
LKQIDFNGTFKYSDEIEVEVSGQFSFALEQNYPNPFNPSTKIIFQLAESGFVSLKIYNVIGSLVTTLINDYRAAGIYEEVYMPGSLPSGIYYYTLKAGSFSETKKMLFLK